MPVTYLGLGSNLGRREENIRSAVEFLKEKVAIEKISSVIETEPVGDVPQGKYLNAVIKGQTSLSVHALLEYLQAIEQRLGRIRTIKNGPRTIDIDILLYSHLKISTPELTIPHPRMMERDFVLIPLREIEPEFIKLVYAND